MTFNYATHYATLLAAARESIWLLSKGQIAGAESLLSRTVAEVEQAHASHQDALTKSIAENVRGNDHVHPIFAPLLAGLNPPATRAGD